MLIDRRSSLRAPIAFGVIEIQRVYGKFTDCTLEGKSAVEGLGCVIAHI